MNELSINGTALSGIYVDASLAYNKPVKDIETFRVPGRNGALVVDNGTWDNLIITYPCFTKSEAAFETVVQALGAMRGYQKIACSNDSAHYRMGVPIVPQNPTVKSFNRHVYFNLSFNCKPQRFLTSGDATTTYSGTGTSTLTNPTNFYSEPLIRVTGNGTLTVNGTQITITGTTGYTDIDCEAMECFNGTTSRNANVTFSTNDFPTLQPGANAIVRGSGISSVIITPRWWEI